MKDHWCIKSCTHTSEKANRERQPLQYSDVSHQWQSIVRAETWYTYYTRTILQKTDYEITHDIFLYMRPNIKDVGWFKMRGLFISSVIYSAPCWKKRLLIQKWGFHSLERHRFSLKKGLTSDEIIWRACAFGPLRTKNAPMMKMHPSVKQMANFWGATMIIGRKTVNAIMMKNTPDPTMSEKDMMDCREGT